jgi:hydroxymethylbilane synthase
LLRAAPAVTTVPVRGNVDTRLRKLRDGQFDAMILAAAGIRRLGLWSDEMTLLSVDEMLPAPGQGALAIEAAMDGPFSDVWAALDDANLRSCIDAEREFVRRIGADCKTPAGCYCRREVDGFAFSAMICSPDGGQLVRCVLRAQNSAEGIAERAADDLLRRGGSDILAQLKHA